WKRHSGDGTGIEDQPNDGPEGVEKKASTLSSVPHRLLALVHPDAVTVGIRVADEAAVDERWSCVGKKREPRWLWHALDHCSGKVWADVCGRRQAEVCLKRNALWEPFGLTRYDTDSWGAYMRHLDVDAPQPGKRTTPQIERKHLTLRTRMKRLV